MILKSTSLSPFIRLTKHGITAEPLVVHVSKFSEGAARRFAAEVAQVKASGQPILPISIDSPGGDAYALLSMIDTIEATGLPTLTLASGKAMSAGAILLACGTKGMRYATPRTTIMVHEVAGGSFGKAGDMASDAEEIARVNTSLFEMLNKSAGKKSGFFQKLHTQAGRADWFLTPEQAKKHGLIDIIGHPHIVAQVEVKIGLLKE